MEWHQHGHRAPALVRAHAAKAGSLSGRSVGERVFVPGAKCFGDVRGLFGGAAAHVVLPGARTIPFAEHLAEQGVLLALAATGYHAHSMAGLKQPDLIVGHGVLGRMIARLGEVVLAGFYDEPLSFVFPPAFMREARIRIAAQWLPSDLVAVKDLAESGRLSLDGLITHRSEAAQADTAYRTAFSDPACLKMILDWRSCS